MRDLALHVAATGHDVTYVTMRHWDASERPSLAGVRVLGLTPAGRVYRRERRTLLPPLRFGLAVAQAPVASRLRVRHRPHGLVPVLPAARGERDRTSPQVRARRELDRGLDEGLLAALRGSSSSGRSAGSCSGACVLAPAHRVSASRGCTPSGSSTPDTRETPVLLPGLYAGSVEPSSTVDVDPQLVVYAGRHVQEKRIDSVVRAFAPARASSVPSFASSSTATAPSARTVEELVDDARARLVRSPPRPAAGGRGRRGDRPSSVPRHRVGARGLRPRRRRGGRARHAERRRRRPGERGDRARRGRRERRRLAGRVAREPRGRARARRRGGTGAPRVDGALVRRERADAADRPLARARGRELRRAQADADDGYAQSFSGPPPCRPDPGSTSACIAGRRRRSRPPGTRARRRPSGPPSRTVAALRASGTRFEKPTCQSSNAAIVGRSHEVRDDEVQAAVGRRRARYRPPRRDRAARGARRARRPPRIAPRSPSSKRSGRRKPIEVWAMYASATT